MNNNEQGTCVKGIGKKPVEMCRIVTDEEKRKKKEDENQELLLQPQVDAEPSHQMMKRNMCSIVDKNNRIPEKVEPNFSIVPSTISSQNSCDSNNKVSTIVNPYLESKKSGMIKENPSFCEMKTHPLSIPLNNPGILVLENKIVANFSVEITKIYEIYDEGLRELKGGFFDVKCVVLYGEILEEKFFTYISKEELLKGKFIMPIPTIILRVSESEFKRLFEKYVNTMIENFKGAVVKVVEYSGWIKVNDRWGYITSTGVIGYGDTTIISRDNYDIQKNSYYHFYNEFLEMRKSLRERGEMDIILLYLFAQHIHSIFKESSFGLKHILFVVGPRGSGKTALSLCFTQLKDKKNPICNFQATKSGMHSELKKNKDRVMLIDDLAPSSDTTLKKDKEEKLESIIRLFGDSTKRVINTDFMEKNADKIDYSVKGGAVITGEYFYGTGSESSIARAVVIDVEKDSVNWQLLTYYQERPEILEGLVYQFIEFVTSHTQVVLDIMKKNEIYYRKQSESSQVRFSNKRYWDYLGQYMATAEILLKNFQIYYGLSKDHIQAALKEFETNIVRILIKNDRAMRVESPVNIVIQSILFYLENGAFVSWGDTLSFDKPIIMLSGTGVFFRQQDLPDIVKNYVKKTNIQSVVGSSSEIANLLSSNGFCEKYTEGSSQRHGKKYKDYGNTRLMCIEEKELKSFMNNLCYQ